MHAQRPHLCAAIATLLLCALTPSLAAAQDYGYAYDAPYFYISDQSIELRDATPAPSEDPCDPHEDDSDDEEAQDGEVLILQGELPDDALSEEAERGGPSAASFDCIQITLYAEQALSAEVFNGCDAPLHLEGWDGEGAPTVELAPGETTWAFLADIAPLPYDAQSGARVYDQTLPFALGERYGEAVVWASLYEEVYWECGTVDDGGWGDGGWGEELGGCTVAGTRQRAPLPVGLMGLLSLGALAGLVRSRRRQRTR